MSEEVKFCILKVVKHFEKCVQSDDDNVLMDEYLDGYTELNKFFALMGKVFGFVSKYICTTRICISCGNLSSFNPQAAM